MERQVSKVDQMNNKMNLESGNSLSNIELVGKSAFWSPNYLEPSGWIEHIPFAFWIIEALRPKFLVELGVHNGVSFFAFCQAIKHLASDTQAYAVDTWQGDEHAGFYGDEIYNKVNEHNRKHYSQFSTLIRSTFDEARNYFPDQSIDLLHIDGLHTYEAVKQDFETWLPKLSSSAVVLFHDINVRERNFGVFQLWEELKEKYVHFDFCFGHGLGVLFMSRPSNPTLQLLLSDSLEGNKLFRFLKNSFANRGRSMQREQEQSHLISRLKDDLYLKTESASQLLLEVEKKNTECKLRDEQLVVLENANVDLKNLVSQLQMLLENEKEIVAKEQIVKDALSREFDILKSDVTTLEKKCSELNQKLTEQEARLMLSQQEIEQQNSLTQAVQFERKLLQSQYDEVNDRLLTIYGSDGWKALASYYSIKGKLLNENSTHYKVLRRSFNFLRGRPTITPGNNKFPQSFQASLREKQQEAEQDIEPPVQPLPQFEYPTVSIVIPVYNAWVMNRQCLESIIAHTKDVAYEVILADDCSTDRTAEIGKWFPNIVHVRNETNKGFLLNCNYAASKARGKYIHFLNNDTQVRDGWLSALVRLMEGDGTIGLAGSKLIYPDGKLQEAGGIIWNDASGWNFGHKQDPNLPDFNYVKEADYVSGASMMIPRSLWEAIGGFDTRYVPAYCEDSDLAFTVRSLGYKVMYQPSSEVIHYEGYSHGSDAQQSEISNIKDHQHINNQKLFEKWKDVLQKEQFTNAEHIFWAKDRSRHKPTLLMVDHYVPHFDKDAGSKTTFQYLQLFVNLGYNVKFLGDNFYKHEPYTTVLQQMGIEVLYGPWYANNWKQWFREHAVKFDYVYLNRPHISIKFVDFFRENSKARILYYGHDLHFIREEKRAAIEADPAILQEAKRWKEMETTLFDKADLVLTCSGEEQKLIKQLNSKWNVQLMQPYIYKELGKPITNFSENKDIMFVGGFGHSPNVDAALWLIREVWPQIRKTLNSIRLVIVGSNPPEQIKALASDDVVITGYVTDAELESLYQQTRLVVVPLRYGAGVKGKTVEAMRYGLPLVSTSYGVEGLPGDASFLCVADDSTGFANTVTSVYNNEDQLRHMSKQSIAYVKEHFTEESAKAILSEALATVK